MRILRPVVKPSPTRVPFLHAQSAGGGAVRPQVIRDNLIRDERVFLQQLSHQL